MNIQLRHPERLTLPRRCRAALRRGLLVVFMASLLGCQAPAHLSGGLPATTPAPTPPTTAEYFDRMCLALTAWAYRHRDWHNTHDDVAPDEEHWDAAFVPTVDAPLLSVFDNPASKDRVQIAAMQKTFEAVAAKFTEAGQQGRSGDGAGAVAAENEGFELLGRFYDLLTDYGFNDQTCPTFFEVTIPG